MKTLYESLLDDFDTLANNMANMFDALGDITNRKKFIKYLKTYVDCFEEFDINNVEKYDKSTLVLSLRPFYDEGIDYEEFTIDKRLLKSKKPIRIFYSTSGLMSHVCNLDYKAELNDKKYKSYVLPESCSLHFKDWLSKTWPEKLKQVL